MRGIAVLLPVVFAFLVGAAPASAWTWPVEGPVMQPFSLGSDPYAGGQHRGVDIGASAGDAVRAPASGLVSFAGTVPRGGLTVTIRTEDGYAVTLVHLGSIAVTKGYDVVEGDVVGAVGPSGETEHASPYVHLGSRVAADENGYVDPLTLLPAPAAMVSQPGVPAAGEEEESAEGETSFSAPSSPASDQPPPATELEPPTTEPAPSEMAGGETAPVASSTAPAELPPVAIDSSAEEESQSQDGQEAVWAPVTPGQGIAPGVEPWAAELPDSPGPDPLQPGAQAVSHTQASGPISPSVAPPATVPVVDAAEPQRAAVSEPTAARAAPPGPVGTSAEDVARSDRGVAVARPVASAERRDTATPSRRETGGRERGLRYGLGALAAAALAGAILVLRRLPGASGRSLSEDPVRDTPGGARASWDGDVRSSETESLPIAADAPTPARTPVSDRSSQVVHLRSVDQLASAA